MQPVELRLHQLPDVGTEGPLLAHTNDYDAVRLLHQPLGGREDLEVPVGPQDHKLTHPGARAAS